MRSNHRQRADRCATSPVQTEVRSTEEAIAAGAMALFGENYGDRVRVVSIPGVQRRVVRRHARARNRRYRCVHGRRGIWRRSRSPSHRSAHRNGGGLPDTGTARVARGRGPGAQHDARARRRHAVQRLQADAKRSGSRGRPAEDEARAPGSGRQAEADAPLVVSGIKVATQRADGLEKTALRGLSDSASRSSRERRGRTGVRNRRQSHGGGFRDEGPDVPGPGRSHRAGARTDRWRRAAAAGRTSRRRAERNASKIQDLLKAVPDVLQKLLA